MKIVYLIVKIVGVYLIIMYSHKIYTRDTIHMYYFITFIFTENRRTSNIRSILDIRLYYNSRYFLFTYYPSQVGPITQSLSKGFLHCKVDSRLSMSGTDFTHRHREISPFLSPFILLNFYCLTDLTSLSSLTPHLLLSFLPSSFIKSRNNLHIVPET